jgi:hypothetical protein
VAAHPRGPCRRPEALEVKHDTAPRRAVDEIWSVLGWD